MNGSYDDYTLDLLIFPCWKEHGRKLWKNHGFVHNLIVNKAETSSSFWRLNSSLLWQPRAWLQRQPHRHRISTAYLELCARVKKLNNHPSVGQASLLETYQPFSGILHAPISFCRCKGREAAREWYLFKEMVGTWWRCPPWVLRAHVQDKATWVVTKKTP